MRRSTGMMLGLALAAGAGAAQAQPAPQGYGPQFAPEYAPQYAPQYAPPPQYAPQYPPQGGYPPNYQQWGDAQNGGYRYSYGDPNGADYYEEEYRRQAVAPPVQYYPAPVYDQAAYPRPCGCGGQGGYEIPTYGYASQNYGWPGQGCCARGGELSFGYMGSSYYGGVGYGGGYGGGYGRGGYYPGEGWYGARAGGWSNGWSSSSASSSARAYSSSSTSVSVR